MNPTILIVDDEPHMLRITELSLRKTGCQIFVAHDGREAVELAAIHLPALIVMDLMMPGMDGLMALKELRARPATRAIPIIMLTSRGQNITRTEAEQAGADLYLTKPFSPSHLAAEAKRIVGVA